jgi:hypothetical protein
MLGLIDFGRQVTIILEDEERQAARFFGHVG